MKRSPRLSAVPAVQLAWSHLGARYRVTAWPDATFERQDDNRWATCEPHDDMLASAAVSVSAAAWRRYLEFVPAPERDFLQQFGFGRFAALQVITRCPTLLPDLALTPALTGFLAAHALLRGGTAPRWAELQAVHERGGIHAVLDWLGLPAGRGVLGALRNLVEADVPRRLLAPLRASLWCPATLAALQRAPGISDHQLARFCHPLAA